MLSVTWLDAPRVPLPGGMCGPSTKTTSGSDDRASPITVERADARAAWLAAL